MKPIIRWIGGKTQLRFFGYKHWTLEDPPRCFYVGKGRKGRSHSRRSRSHKWHHIVNRLGLRVEECVGPMSNQRACTWEMQYIPLMGTRSDNHDHNNDADIGCNFTDGGEGTSGRALSLETRTKISKMVSNPSAETRAKMRAKALLRTPISAETHVKLSMALMGNINCLGHKHTSKTKEKQRAKAQLQNPPSAETRKKMSANNAMKRPEIREKVSRTQIGRIVSNEARAKMRVAHARRRCIIWFVKQMSE